MGKNGLLILLFSFLCLEATSQSFYAIRKERGLIGSVGTGVSTYYGELQNPGHYLDTKLNLNFGLQYFLTKRFAARAEVTWFQLGASDKNADDDRVIRNLSFSSNNYELNAEGIINLFPHGNRFYRRPYINFYAFAGVGLLYMNPTTIDKNGKKVALQPLKTEGVSYSRFQFVIPYGLGIKLKNGPYFNVAIEGGYRKTFTDYLDDVSGSTEVVNGKAGRYPDPSTLSSQQAIDLSDRRGEWYAAHGQPGFVPVPGVGVRGNPKTKDSYFIFNIKLEYYLPLDVSRRGSGLIYNKHRKSNYRYNKTGGMKRR